MIMAETDHNPAGEEEREMEVWMAMARERIREDFGGYVFICDDHHFSMQVNPRRCMFGMTDHFQDPILHITPGTLLFVFDCKTSHAYGVYEAISHGGMNLDKTAWHDHIFTHESRYPAQVCVRLVELYHPLPENMFWPVIGHDYPAEYIYSAVINLVTPSLFIQLHFLHWFGCCRLTTCWKSFK